MHATKVIVVSPSRDLSAALSQELPRARYDVLHVRPGTALIAVTRGERPRVAVLDRIDERPEAAQLEIAVLKERWPGIEIIALSRHSSELDSSVVEQGVFYYAAEVPVDQLIRLIHAAKSAAEKAEQRT